MALATLDNVTARVAGIDHTVSLAIEETGLTVGSFGTIPWVGSTVSVLADGDGCHLHLNSANGVAADFFVPAGSFQAVGGSRAMATFAGHLARSAAALGARVVEPAA